MSYVFYGLTDWKMLLLLIGSTVVFHGMGRYIRILMDSHHERRASVMTTMSVCLGVAILLFFKYLNFFAESIAALFSTIGLNVSWTTLNIIVPIGVSFFTFKLISYIIEIHRDRIKPVSLEQFAAYIAFFPTILSGPIDKPDKFLLQISKPRLFDRPLAVDGCRQVLWGMMIKMCVADNLVYLTDSAWISTDAYPASNILLAALVYPLQLYTDFNGYSHMAIGVAKILGIKVERNFNHPLLARNTAEYWRRWHMSLTTWITNYIFMPLNVRFRNIGKWGICLAAIINLVVIGLWHGANWTYALFGLYHGLLFIPLVFSGSFGKNKKLKPVDFSFANRTLKMPGWKNLSAMFLTYCLVALGLVIFRAPDVQTALSFLAAIPQGSLLTMPKIEIGLVSLILTAFIVILDWTARNDEHPLQTICRQIHQRWIRWILYYAIIAIILRYQGAATQFIYFQF